MGKTIRYVIATALGIGGAGLFGLQFGYAFAAAGIALVGVAVAERAMAGQVSTE